MFFCNLCDGRVVVVLYKIVCYGSPAINLKIRSLRLHAAQAYSRHIFEHEINVKVQKFTKKCMLNTSGCLVILISQ